MIDGDVMAWDDSRQRLDNNSDEELIEILRHRDTEEWREIVFPLAEAILRSRGIDAAQALARLPQPETEPPPAEEFFVPVASFATVVESEACRSALLAAGFKVMTADECLLRLDPALGPALGGVRLAVPGGEAEDARAFLASAESGDLPAGLIERSDCGSTDVVSERVVNRSGTLCRQW